MKYEQLHLFPDMVSPPKIKTDRCLKCGRKISSGIIGPGCLRKIKADIKRSQELLKKALEK